MAQRKIAVVTGTRADYGILSSLLRAIEADPSLELQLLVTGSHLAAEFGTTVREIEADGFPIARKIEMLASADSPEGVVKSIGMGCTGLADALHELRPEILVILGDRFEALAAAITALICRIPIAHIHGGELSFGAFDESIRHSITKMSSFHFTATAEYRKRVIQMGEQPERVYLCGAPGLDGLKEMALLTKEQLEAELGFVFQYPTAIVTYHPVTLEQESAAVQIKALIGAIEATAIHAIFTGANADPEGRLINKMVAEFCLKNKEKYTYFPSLGRLKYFSTLKYADLMLGNSSSGLIEAPSFHLPVVNIGDRQLGRIAGDNVIQIASETAAIIKAIQKALSPEFKAKISQSPNPYRVAAIERAGVFIKDVLKSVPLGETLLKKHFYDLDFKP
jgi:GDP/UDP-N,N'-diacetylbacillosamine 2-epimerase (hydrolysing)